MKRIFKLQFFLVLLSINICNTIPIFAQSDTILTEQTATIEKIEMTAELTTEKLEVENVSPDSDIIGEFPEKIKDLISSLEWYDFLMILVFTLLGYISPFIPLLRKIGDTEVRVGVAAIVLIMIFASMDISSAWKLIIEFVISTKLYENVFSLIKKTPSPTVKPVLVLGDK